MKNSIQREGSEWRESKKAVIIFGGTGGLGRQIADLMSDKYCVTVAGSADCDIRNFQETNAYLRNKQPDIVLNFSGFNSDRALHKIDSVDAKAAIETIEVNNVGSMNIGANCLPGMRDREYGRLIMISSVLATRDVFGTAVYSATKAFIDRLVKSISHENISKHVTANSIQLGYFDAGLTHKLADPEAVKQSLPLKRFGKIQELMNAIEFFINTEYATGVNLALNGGL